MSDPTDRPDGSNGDTGTVVPGTALATVTEWDDRAASVRTSIVTDNDNAIATYINALAGSDSQLQEATGKEIVVVDWLLHIREAIDETTGEVSPRLRLVLITEDGKRIAGGSKSVIDGWASVVRLFAGRKPFPSLGVTLQKHKGSKPGTHYVTLANVRVIPQTKPRK